MNISNHHIIQTQLNLIRIQQSIIANVTTIMRKQELDIQSLQQSKQQLDDENQYKLLYINEQIIKIQNQLIENQNIVLSAQKQIQSAYKKIETIYKNQQSCSCSYI